MNEQFTLFDYLYPKYKITKPIRIIELFAGYGSQALALKYLEIPFEHWKICEWAIKSIQAYKDLHFPKRDVFLDKMRTKEEKVDFLYRLGISSNYNEPMKIEQISKLKEQEIDRIIKNIAITNNLVNIQQVKGKDLEIVDTDKYTYIMTYSFPCQDLSLAGKGKGMSDTSTRSGMLWEVERILLECKELKCLPEILLMENVPQVHGDGNIEDFNKWQLQLENLGYKNYFKDLIATDYGIPQTRNRCFMISVLGDYSYKFPKPMPLKLKLKDLLEDEVDKKYYLSDKMINFFYKNEKKQQEKGNGFRFNVSNGDVIAKTITTRAGSRMDDNFILNNFLKETLENNDVNSISDVAYIDSYNKNVRQNNLSETITTRVDTRSNTFLAIKNATKKGYLEAKIGDGIDLSQPNSKTRRGRVQKEKIQTLTTSCDVGTIVNAINKSAKHQQDMIQDTNGSARTLVCGTHGNGGHYTKTLLNDLRIRKLTPKECFRLMGVKDEDYELIAKNQSNSSLYHLAGDSIVVNVLMAIFSTLFDKGND